MLLYRVSLIISRYGGFLLSDQKIVPFNFLVVYLAVIQGSLAAGQWLSFGPSKFFNPLHRHYDLMQPRHCSSLSRS
jgi:hypothetical protein